MKHQPVFKKTWAGLCTLPFGKRLLLLLLIVTCLEHGRLCPGLGLETERELVAGLGSHRVEGPEKHDRVLLKRAGGLTEYQKRERGLAECASSTNEAGRLS